MVLDGRQTVEAVDDVFVGDLLRFGDGFALGELGQHRAGGDGRDAAEGFELDIFDGVLVYFEIDPDDVAADRVADLAHGVGIFDFTEIFRFIEIG